MDFERKIESKNESQEQLRIKGEEFESNLYHEYLEDLGLREDDLKNKKILDVGAGNRMFAGHCIRKGINENVYSLEPKVGKVYQETNKYLEAIWSPEVWQKINSRTVKAIREKIPFEDQSFDLVFIHSAMPGSEILIGQDEVEAKENIDKTFAEIIRILKVDGEARLYPFYGKKYDLWKGLLRELLNKKITEERENKKLKIEVQKIREHNVPIEDDVRIIIKKLKE